MPEIISRDNAQSMSRKRYFTGEPCLRGHIAERFVSSGGCVDCVCRKTPKSADARKQRFLPAAPLFFGNIPGPRNVTEQEAVAAFRLMELYGWHEHAIEAIRADEQLAADLAYKPKFTEMLRKAYADRTNAWRKNAAAT